MTVKEYLGQVYYADREIRKKMAEIESYRELSVSISNCISSDKVQTSHDGEAPYVKYMCRIVDLEKEVHSCQEKKAMLQYEIGCEIDKLQNQNERLVLRYRYLLCMRWEEIAERLSYSRRWVLKMHQSGVEKMKTILKEKCSP